MSKHVKMHYLHKLFNRNNVKVSYNSLPNSKSVINGHNKNILSVQENPSPCSCRDKASCPLNVSCQHKCVLETFQPRLEPFALHRSHRISFKDSLYKHNSFKYECKRNSIELSNFVWVKRKENVNSFMTEAVII